MLRQFRAFFIRMLRQVHAVYPDAKFELDARGMRLWNSPPPITKRIIVITKE